MEPWKLGVIALLVAGAIGYGMFTNSPANIPVGPSNLTIGSGGAVPLPVPTPSKYNGKTLPDWPNLKQWINTPAPVHLPALKGKPVLLEVFRVECSHCQDAAPYLVELHKRYAPRGVEFVAVQSPAQPDDAQSPENDWKTVQGWVKEKGYTWPVGFDAKSAWFQGKFGKDVFYPSLFLFNPNGKVVFFQSGHNLAKGLELGIQLEKIAPGNGTYLTRANDLSRFLSTSLGMDNGAQKQLSSDLSARLSGTTTAPKAASMFSPALLLLSAPIGFCLWVWQRRKKAQASA